MSIYTTSLSQLGTADLQELLNDGAVENARLEFKLVAPNKDDTLKKLSSFANTFGGFMVIGASARSTDGRIEGLPGIDPVAGYKQKIVQWAFDGATPPLTVEVSDPIPVPAGDGKVCYVIYTPESDVAPHFLNGRKGVWVRTDEFSSRFEARLADDSELRQLFDRRKLIQERRVSILERAKKRFYPHTAVADFGPRLDLCIVPRFPARPLCEQEMLKQLITGSRLAWRQTMFPEPSSRVVSQYESAIVPNAVGSNSMFEANIWGMLFYGRKIADEEKIGRVDKTRTFGIHLYGFVGHVLLFIRHADQIFRALGYSGSLVIEVALTSILRVPWLYGPDGLYAHEGSPLDDDITFSITTTSAALREKPDDIATDILRCILFAVNWHDWPDAELEKLLHGGRRYNFWSK